MKHIGRSGFTLLEVMIAMAIMAVGMAAIISVEHGSLEASMRARELNAVSMLAKNMMLDAEAEFEGKPFSQVKEETSGPCAEPYKHFTCSRKIKEIAFPKLNLSGLAAGGGAGSSGGDDPQNQDASMVDKITKLVSKYLSKAVREVTVTVEWPQGKSQKQFSVSTYWVDLNSEFQLNE